jgi:hypothetical protein
MYKGIRLSNIIDNEPILKFKLPNYVHEKTLGRFNPKLNWMTFEQEYEIIIDVKRIIMYCIELMKCGWDMSFDQVFSHVVSHEYLHYLFFTQMGKLENECFDNLFGSVSNDPKYVYSGIKFEGDPPYIMSKCNFITKLINTIRNKVVVIKYAMHKMYKKFQLHI